MSPIRAKLAAFILSSGLLAAACAPQPPSQPFQATLAASVTAPIYTPTPTRTPTPTASATPSLTPTATLTVTPSPTLSPTPTTPPSPTAPLLTLTPASAAGAPNARPIGEAGLAATQGWSCGDFPCADDIDAFLERIQVPGGFGVRHFGRFPGQPLQIAFGRDGRLYATVLENGTRSGAVYALNADGSAERYTGDFVSPLGLAFQPGTDVLYVSARLTETAGGALYRIPPGSAPEIVREDLPCCFQVMGSQPNGMVFGPDGYLYLGVGALTDHAEPPDPRTAQFAELNPLEASVLRIQPHTGESEVYARGLRNPYDVAFDSAGSLYATDQGLVTGEGDRLLAVQPGGHYGWPYWRARGCAACPFAPPNLALLPDLLPFSLYALPRGLIAYTGTQYPANLFDSLFVVLWNGIEGGQRVVRIDPRTLPDDAEALAAYVPQPFVTGLIRPTDIALAPDGSLVVADSVYGHVWQVEYLGSQRDN
jgi:glucose/arabinose dehydrogenase